MKVIIHQAPCLYYISVSPHNEAISEWLSLLPLFFGWGQVISVGSHRWEMVEQNLKSGSAMSKLLRLVIPQNCVCIIVPNCEASSQVPANV